MRAYPVYDRRRDAGVLKGAGNPMSLRSITRLILQAAPPSLKRRVKRLTVSAVQSAGIHRSLRSRAATRILMYHRVLDRTTVFDSPFNIVSTENFEAQMHYLAKNYDCLSLEDFADIARVGRPTPRRSVVITFDDGYRDNYVSAFPALLKYGLPATFFVSSDPIGTDELLWPDRVSAVLNMAGSREIEAGLAGPLRCDLRSDAIGAHLAIHTQLKLLPVAEREATIARLAGALNVDLGAIRYASMLSWDEIREMDEAGMSIGSHTRSHPVLSRLPVEEIERELRESKETIERQLGHTVRTFAYPCGSPSDIDQRVVASARQHYEAAVTTFPGLCTTSDDLHLLRRIHVDNDPVERFAVKIELPWLAHC